MRGAPHVAILAAARDEAPRILEWVAHQKAIGADAVLVATNDCRDGTDTMLERLAALGHVVHVRNVRPFRPFSIRMSALARLRFQPAAANARWLMALDTDDFPEVAAGAGTFGDLLSALPDTAEAVLLPRRDRWAAAPLPPGAALAGGCRHAGPAHGVRALVRGHTRFPLLRPDGPGLPNRTPAEAAFPVPTVSPDGAWLDPRTLTQPRRAPALPDPDSAAGAAFVAHMGKCDAGRAALKSALPDPARRATAARGLPDPAPLAARVPAGPQGDGLARSAAARTDWLALFRADPELADLEARAAEAERAALTRLAATEAGAAFLAAAVPPRPPAPAAPARRLLARLVGRGRP